MHCIALHCTWRRYATQHCTTCHSIFIYPVASACMRVSRHTYLQTYMTRHIYNSVHQDLATMKNFRWFNKVWHYITLHCNTFVVPWQYIHTNTRNIHTYTHTCIHLWIQTCIHTQGNCTSALQMNPLVVPACLRGGASHFVNGLYSCTRRYIWNIATHIWDYMG